MGLNLLCNSWGDKQKLTFKAFGSFGESYLIRWAFRLSEQNERRNVIIEHLANMFLTEGEQARRCLPHSKFNNLLIRGAIDCNRWVLKVAG